MKKTLIALMALAGMATAADTNAVDVTWTFTNLEKPTSTTPTSLNRFYTRSGVSFVLQSTSDAYKVTSTVAEATLGETIFLDSITLPYINSAFNNAWGIICDSDGKVVALSSSRVNTAADADMTFNFSNLELNVGDQYGLVFFQASQVSSQAAMQKWIVDNNWDVSGSKAHSNFQFTAVTSDYTSGPTLSTIKDNNSNFSPSNTDTSFLPAIKIVGHSVYTPTPEPATATLSLLALAGLAARRRRH